jgi:hypothetical protein
MILACILISLPNLSVSVLPKCISQSGMFMKWTSSQELFYGHFFIVIWIVNKVIIQLRKRGNQLCLFLIKKGSHSQLKYSPRYWRQFSSHLLSKVVCWPLLLIIKECMYVCMYVRVNNVLPVWVVVFSIAVALVFKSVRCWGRGFWSLCHKQSLVLSQHEIMGLR